MYSLRLIRKKFALHTKVSLHRDFINQNAAAVKCFLFSQCMVILLTYISSTISELITFNNMTLREVSTKHVNMCVNYLFQRQTSYFALNTMFVSGLCLSGNCFLTIPAKVSQWLVKYQKNCSAPFCAAKIRVSQRGILSK